MKQKIHGKLNFCRFFGLLDIMIFLVLFDQGMLLTDLAKRLQLDHNPNTFIIEFLVIVQVHVLAALYIIKEALFAIRSLHTWYKLRAEFTNSVFNNRASKVALITGGDGTIGHKLVELLLSRGWLIHVVTSCKTRAGDFFTSHGILHGTETKLILHECDLSRLDEVQDFALLFKKENLQIDLIICNSGVLHPKSAWNDEAAIAGMNINLVSHAFLIESLRRVLARDVRIMMVGSCCSHAAMLTKQMIANGSSFIYTASGPYQAYALSKLIMALYAKELARSLDASHPGSRVITVHPGVVPGGLYRNTNPLTRFSNAYILPWLLRNPDDAALLCLHTAFRDDIINGSYYENGKVVSLGSHLDFQDRTNIYELIKEEIKAVQDKLK